MIRKARLDDIENILNTIEPYVTEGILLEKTQQDIVVRLRDFFIYEEDGRLSGCVALFPGWDALGEICTLAVDGSCTNKGIGTELVQACIQDARELGLPKIFALTYEKEFFSKFGFKEVDKHTLPQKIFKDCIKCPHYLDCRETAVVLEL